MTLKGKRNHYNVKLLRGYGVLINVKDNHLILKNGQNDITGISEKEEWFDPRKYFGLSDEDQKLSLSKVMRCYLLEYL